MRIPPFLTLLRAALAFLMLAAGLATLVGFDRMGHRFTALGAAGADAQPEAFYRGIYDHVIAMDGYTFH